MRINLTNTELANELRLLVQQRTQQIDDGEAVAAILLWSFIEDHARAHGLPIAKLAQQQWAAFVAYAQKNLSLVRDGNAGSAEGAPTLPPHLQDDAPPVLRCSLCGRKSWTGLELGLRCNMLQPDESRCGGKMLPLGVKASRSPEEVRAAFEEWFKREYPEGLKPMERSCAHDGFDAGYLYALGVPEVQPQPQMICPRCKVDRFKEACPGPHSACPMKAEAQTDAGVDFGGQR